MPESLSAETLHRSRGHRFDADQRIGSRPATAADVDRYYGARPRQTVKAMILTLDGNPAAIVGLANEGSYWKLFSEYKPEFKRYLQSMATLRAIKKVILMIGDCRLPVVAVTQPNEPDSPRLLERLGFVFHNESEEGSVYEWRG